MFLYGKVESSMLAELGLLGLAGGFATSAPRTDQPERVTRPHRLMGGRPMLSQR